MSKDIKYFVRLRIGHKSEMLDRPTSAGMTHRWTVFVHSFSGIPFTDRSFISKVVFELHPDFSTPRRVVKEPPFEVSELGYAGFSIPIHITFTGASKVYKLTYDMNLVLEKHNEQFMTQTIEMKQPSSAFRELILKYGGAKKDSDKKKEKHRLKKRTIFSSQECVSKKEKKSRAGSNPPLRKLKIARSRVSENDEQKKLESASSENLSAISKTAAAVEVKISSMEMKESSSSEIKPLQTISSEPCTSVESNSSDSEASKSSAFSVGVVSSLTPTIDESENMIEKQFNFEFLVRLQKKLMTLEDPVKISAVVDALLTPSLSSPCPPLGLLLTDNNLLSFDICKLSSSLIGKLDEICFGSTSEDYV